jgi:hypothetical protein
MKTSTKLLLTALVVTGFQFALTGCVAEVGGRGYYGGGPWYHDGGWMDGGRWGGGPRVGVGIDVHPPGFRR